MKMVSLLKNRLKTSFVVGVAALSAHAAGTLFSNYTMNVNETGKVGSLWVFSRGDIYSGVTQLSLKVGSSGIRVEESPQEQMSDSMSAVYDGFFGSVLAEHRRIPSVNAGKLGYVLPMIGLDDDGNHQQPEGFFSVRGIDNLIETPLSLPVTGLLLYAFPCAPIKTALFPSI